MSTEVATQKLFFDSEKTKLVLEGDEEAKILACAPGDAIPEGFKVPSGAKADAVKFAADQAKEAEKAEAARADAEKQAEKDRAAAVKQAEVAANKQAEVAANKSGSGVAVKKAASK